MILKCKNFLNEEKTIFTMKVVFSLYIKCFIEKTGSLLRGKDGTLLLRHQQQEQYLV